jgi:flavin reductase (DIM6/NTAB) family NADH-FMN oxidoreductase RutF
MVALAVHKGTLTHDYIERSGEFTISLPNLALMEKVRDAGMKSGRDVRDKFAELGLEPVAGEALDTPVVAGCLAYLECSVVEAYDAGEDHTVFFAEVVAASAEQEAFRETWLLEEEEAKPLHHLGGHKYALLEKLLDAAAREEEQE